MLSLSWAAYSPIVLTKAADMRLGWVQLRKQYDYEKSESDERILWKEGVL